MKVKMKTRIAGYHPGPDGNSVAWPDAGTELELPDHEGAKLVAAGLAEPVVDKKEEKAVVPEHSEKRGGGGRKFLEDED